MEISRQIDHIVFGVTDLDEAIISFEKLTGVQPIFGGYHKQQGTKNALVNLNNGCYLELIAADDSNTAISPPRWMGIDVLTKSQPVRWALKSANLEGDSAVLKKFNNAMGNISSGSRNMKNDIILSWEIIMPLPLPEVEILPFMVDWSNTDLHPSAALPFMDCELAEFNATHPNPAVYNDPFKALNIIMSIEKSSTPSLQLTLKTPKGIVHL